MICPSCEKGCCSPVIKTSPILIVKEIVTHNEMQQDQVFTQRGVNKYGHDENTNIYYLNRELGMAGLQLSTMSLTNFYMHVPPKGGRTKEEKAIVEGCKDFSITEVIKVAQGKKIILLSGAEVIKTFTGYNASDVYGLVCSSDYLPTVPVIIPCPNVDKLMNSPIGELRNALKVLAEQKKILDEYMKI